MEAATGTSFVDTGIVPSGGFFDISMHCDTVKLQLDSKMHNIKNWIGR